MRWSMIRGFDSLKWIVTSGPCLTSLPCPWRQCLDMVSKPISHIYQSIGCQIRVVTTQSERKTSEQ